MKDVVCKYCNAVNKHHSFKCFNKAKKFNSQKTKKPIANFSDKMLIELRKYRKLRDKYFEKNPYCEFKGCGSPNIVLHHKKTREYHLCDVSVFMSCCDYHHRWIHENDKEARELGYLLQSI